jgi:glyoxylase-like metal-dependent hydrolase (beta-lactamase superfamily II)
VKGGSGANGAVFLGENEILVIDAKMSEGSTRQMLEEVRKLSANPIGFVALTHSDGDHVNGLPGLPAGVKLISHDETRRYMDEAFKEDKLRAYLPQVTFFDKLDLHIGPHVIHLLNFGPAHTSGDAILFFPEDKVAIMGDLLFVGRDPLIHRSKNGSSFGLVKTLRAALELDAEVFLSGHADKVRRTEVEAMIKAVEEKQARVKAMVAEGKSLDEVRRFYGVEDKPGPGARPRWPSLAEVIYLELTEKK